MSRFSFSSPGSHTPPTNIREHGGFLEAVEKRSPPPAARIFQCILIDKSFLLAISSEKLVYPPFPQYISTALMNIFWQTSTWESKVLPQQGTAQVRNGRTEISEKRFMNLATERQAFWKVYLFCEPAGLLKHLQRTTRHWCSTFPATLEKSERFLSESQTLLERALRDVSKGSNKPQQRCLQISAWTTRKSCH